MLSRRALLGGLALAGAATPFLARAEGEELVPTHPPARPAVRRRPAAARPAAAPAHAAAAPPASVAHGAPLTAEEPGVWSNPDEALGRLKQGNAVFARGGASMALPSWTRIQELAQGQKPFAIIVGCSDSRVPPELIFDCSLGELFVVRVAGSTVDRVGLGSILYAVEHLGAPLIVVLGHTKCGAVAAAVDVVTHHTDLHGALNDMVLPILPAVLKAEERTPADLLDASVRENVRRTAEQLKYADALLASRIAAGRLKIVSACYNLSTAQVDFVA